MAKSKARDTQGGILRPGIAIPTEFKGQVYRSRFEANVAQFLCDMGLKYKYEHKSFLVGGKHYCPDFYLPDTNQYIEVRGYEKEGSEEELEGFVKQYAPLIVFYKDKAEELRATDGNVDREDLTACICDDRHCGWVTLGYLGDGHPCFVCRIFGKDRRDWRYGYMHVSVRSSIPFLITDNAHFLSKGEDNEA